MVIENHIRGRRRILDCEKKARLCALLSQESYSIEQAADALDVSLRTVQRERRYDQDFDHDVRLALQSPPDPLKLMEHAARTHWRAAAWLLERKNPEEFARKPANTTSPKRAMTALRAVQEAALEAIPPELHAAVYRRTQEALDEAFSACFPLLDQWGAPKPKPSLPTPLADAQYSLSWPAPTFFPELDEQRNIVLPPVDSAAPAPQPTAFETRLAQLQARLAELRRQEAEEPDEGILSPETSKTTEFNSATEFNASRADFTLQGQVESLECLVETNYPEAFFENDDFDHPDAEDPRTRFQLLDERLRRHQRQERQKARAAEKKDKAARKRAQAQRRRAA